MFKVVEKFRLTTGAFASDKGYENNGVFIVPISVKILGKEKSYRIQEHGTPDYKLQLIASDGMDWEHVSVSLLSAAGNPVNRTPTWDEMNFVKNLFWGEEDCVVQFHPPKSEYVNRHIYVLHLWRQCGKNFETPHKSMVG